MGMAPATAAWVWPSIIAGGSSIAQLLSMPDGQELESFTGALDPRQMLTQAGGNITDMIGLLKQRANQPVNLRSAYVQQPPVMAGGGLPMPIGVSGQDPALADPSLLSLPGLQLPDSLGQSRPRQHPGGVDQDGYHPSPDAIIDPDRTAVPLPPGSPTGTQPGGPRRRNAVPSPASSSQSMSSGAPNVSEYDDLDQGAGAVELLLRSMMPMPGTSRATTPRAV